VPTEVSLDLAPSLSGQFRTILLPTVAVPKILKVGMPPLPHAARDKKDEGGGDDKDEDK
jgi:hypothetical protein